MALLLPVLSLFRRLRREALPMLGAFACAACAAAPGSVPASTGVTLAPHDRPQSAYVALVRTLETIDAIRTTTAEVRLRAIECESMMDRRRGGDFVRVVLDLTVLSGDFDTADAVFDVLERALGVEAAATERGPAVTWDRAQRVFTTMQWNAPRVVDDASFADIVSVSRSLRLEVRERRSLAIGGPSSDGRGASQDAEEYILEIADDDALRLGPLVNRSYVVHPKEGIADIRYRIRPVEREAQLSRAQIGGFLHELEARSPNVRVTRVKISPSSPGADVAVDGWTFEADMSVRVLES